MVEVNFTSYKESIKVALDKLNATDILKKQKHILIKPNIVNKDPFPVTTHPETCSAIIEYIKTCSNAEIIVGDGGGMPEYTTIEAFTALGYNKVAEKHNVKLVDLNHVPIKLFKNADCMVHQEIYLPEMIETHYIISVPVLKAHSLSRITGSIKNMMGLLPPKHYRGKYGVWNKAVFHHKIQQSISDLYHYVSPNLTIMDASVGLAEYHLGGPTCNPPVNKILAGYDAKEIDRKVAELLGFSWKNIGHLQ